MGDEQVVCLEVQQHGNLSILVAGYELNGSKVSDSVSFNTHDLNISSRKFSEKYTSLEDAALTLAENMIESGARMCSSTIEETETKLTYTARSRVKKVFDAAYNNISANLEENLCTLIDIESVYD